MRRLGVVCAFTDEEPLHSPYSVRGLVSTLSCLSDISILGIANGAEVSEELRTLFDKTPHATLVELKENIGAPEAWNMGIERLECEVLFILNDDLWLDAECVVKLAKLIEEKSDTAMAGVEGVTCASLDGTGFPVAAKEYKKSERKGFFNTARKWSESAVKVSFIDGFLFALSGEFIKKTGFRFDTRYTPAFCEVHDLACFARSNGYKARILLGLDSHYDHLSGVSAHPVEIKYLGKTVMSNELLERNRRLFCEKWKESLADLITP